MNFETMRLDGSGEQKRMLVVIRKLLVVYYKRLTTNYLLIIMYNDTDKRIQNIIFLKLYFGKK
jgi:hypothetical protein